MKKTVILLLALGAALFSLTGFAEEAPQPSEPAACAHRYEYTSLGDGTHAAVCALCGETAEEACVYTDAAVLPTQTAAGYILHTCEKCGDQYREETLPAEKDRAESVLMGDTDKNGAVSAEDARSVLRACISLAPLSADRLPYADLNGDGRVTVADARLTLRASLALETGLARHQYVSAVEKAPACTASGIVNYRCAYCGETGVLTAPALGHRFGKAAVTPSTCTAKGLSARVCGVCGYTEKINLPLAPHTWADGGRAVACAVCGGKAEGFVNVGKTTFYCLKGEKQYSWTAVGGAYYFFDRATGAMRAGTHVDGLAVGADGKAATDGYTTEKIRTFIKAKNIVASITDPWDSVDVKKEKAFRWVMKHPYCQYRGVGESMNTPGFEMLFANDIFDRGNGCCGSTSYAFAFLAVECGCREVYVVDDGVSSGGHAWVTMEGNNNVYDVIFAKAKSFSKNYNYATSDYRKYAPRKTYIGG